MAAAAILDSRIHKILLADSGQMSGRIFCGGSKMTGSHGFPLTKPMAVNTGLAQLRYLWSGD